jgi:hypothetical protein
MSLILSTFRKACARWGLFGTVRSFVFPNPPDIRGFAALVHPGSGLRPVIGTVDRTVFPALRAE